MGLIYKITCNITEKCYIGQTVNSLEIRIKQHLYNVKIKKYNSLLHKAIRKYGWEHFNVEVLEDDIPLDILTNKEIFYTLKYNALAPNGYVLLAGKNNDQIISKEVRQKMSKAKKGKSFGEKNNFYGKCHSKEQKIKWSIERKDKKNCKAKIVVCFDLNNIFLKEYKSMGDASRELNIAVSNICVVCQGKIKQINNYKFKYKI